MPTLTTAVSVTFTLDSSIASPPYEVSGCQGTISFNDNTPPVTFTGWNAEEIGTPDPNGASFTLQVTDSNYSNAASGVANWALTFIPRGTTRAASPFGNNQNTITGAGAASSNGSGTFTLDVGNARITNSGDWDWALLVQMTVPGGSIKCFSSDPEMEVGA